MRRFGVIVALGAMLGMFAGVATASPALAGRGPKWEFQQAPDPFFVDPSYCGFGVEVTSVSKEFEKILKTQDGAVIFLTTGSFEHSYTNLSTGKTITVNESASGRATVNADGSVTVVGTGVSPNFLNPAEAERFGLPTVAVV